MSGADIAAIFGGAVVTVSLSLVGILIGLPIGLGLALIRWSNVPFVARIVVLYVSILRATPLVTLLLLLFFALPNIGVPIGAVSAAILAVVLNTSAFNAWGGPGLSAGRCGGGVSRRPARSRQRNVPADQGDARAGRGGCRRHHTGGG